MYTCSYLGRHRVDKSGTEPRVPGTRWLLTPARSYFMICYLLSSRGARKLLAADPFHSLLPTDEFINLMRGKPSKYVTVGQSTGPKKHLHCTACRTLYMYICDTKHSLLLERVTVCFYSDAGNVHPGHEICYNFRQLVFHLALSQLAASLQYTSILKKVFHLHIHHLLWKT